MTKKKLYGVVYLIKDIKRLKRFFISVLWRAHISNRPEFNRVCLGPYGKLAKEALTNDDALDNFDLSFAEFIDDKIGWLNPHTIKSEGVNTVVLYMNRFIVYIKVDKRPFSTDIKALSLNSINKIVCVQREFWGSKEQKLMSSIIKEEK